jgi:hypothetical protein
MCKDAGMSGHELDRDLARSRTVKAKLRRLLLGPPRNPDSLTASMVKGWNWLRIVNGDPRLRRQDEIAGEDLSEGEVETALDIFSERLATERRRTLDACEAAFLRGDADFFEQIAREMRRVGKTKNRWPDKQRLLLLKAAMVSQPVNISRVADEYNPHGDREHIARQLRRVARRIGLREGKPGRPKQ